MRYRSTASSRWQHSSAVSGSCLSWRKYLSFIRSYLLSLLYPRPTKLEGGGGYTGFTLYIKWTVFVNVTTKSAQHAHARMIAIIVEKSPNSSHMYDHGFMDNTNRQAVCKSQKKSFEWFTNSRRITFKTIKTYIFSQQYCWLSTLLSTTCIIVQNHHGAEEFQLLDEEHSTVKREVIQKKIRRKDGKPTQTYEMGTYTF